MLITILTAVVGVVAVIKGGSIAQYVALPIIFVVVNYLVYPEFSAL